MTEQQTPNRRDFVKGAATGAIGGALLSMGVYSYSPTAYSRMPKVACKQADFSACRSVKVTSISETRWFNNAHLVGDIHAAGGLLVDQYSINWPPFGNGKGVAQGSYEDGINSIRKMIPGDLEEA
ncbi:twin-arginine translocation signal domain-containing protein [Breoghania sp.]|uniref:twin-arginine translocation signal domain-containing protein n=1 Tax=Breoghania sp. TaxID=2065378 RepID=UPI002624825E|nr:twin-arginine translocation signal domain-containing protein [Breoghania sp.]MDJ0932877.1 twin-arginine translocation signal domain-containing protein [Breoghania sp.]